MCSPELPDSYITSAHGSIQWIFKVLGFAFWNRHFLEQNMTKQVQDEKFKSNADCTRNSKNKALIYKIMHAMSGTMWNNIFENFANLYPCSAK